jgi:hypothetical protein
MTDEAARHISREGLAALESAASPSPLLSDRRHLERRVTFPARWGSLNPLLISRVYKPVRRSLAANPT